MDIHQPDSTGPIFINQSSYSRRVLQEFRIENCNPVTTPQNTSVKPHKRLLETEPPTNASLYREIIGKLMHLVVYIYFDLAQTVSKLRIQLRPL